jgi:hypothetical protein
MPCPMGFTSSGAASVCVKCAAGTFNAIAGMGECMPCPAG